MILFFSSVLPSATWTKFFLVVTGKTNNTHEDFIRKIKNKRHIEVTNPEDCDYCLHFCTTTSRVQTAVEAALRQIPGEK